MGSRKLQSPAYLCSAAPPQAKRAPGACSPVVHCVGIAPHAAVVVRVGRAKIVTFFLPPEGKQGTWGRRQVRGRSGGAGGQRPPAPPSPAPHPGSSCSSSPDLMHYDCALKHESGWKQGKQGRRWGLAWPLQVRGRGSRAARWHTSAPTSDLTWIFALHARPAEGSDDRRGEACMRARAGALGAGSGARRGAVRCGARGATGATRRGMAGAPCAALTVAQRRFRIVIVPAAARSSQGMSPPGLHLARGAAGRCKPPPRAAPAGPHRHTAPTSARPPPPRWPDR